jgi:hypothetical protein
MSAARDQFGGQQPAAPTPPASEAPRPPTVAGGVLRREITETDLEMILDLLCEGFFQLPRRYWASVLEKLRNRTVPDGLPRYGFMLESQGRAVGLLLMIVSVVHRDGKSMTRSNGASWLVHPDFRIYAPLLLDRSLRVPVDCHLNVFAEPHTFPLIESRGFKRLTNGVFIAVPAMVPGWRHTRIVNAGNLDKAKHPIPDTDREILVDHLRAGRISLWVETNDGGYPFIFRRRRIRSWVPCADLIYCRDLEDFGHLAGAIGRYLLYRGMPIVMATCNGPIPGIPGKYIDGKFPTYYRGEMPPRGGDIAYTKEGLF